MKGSVTILQGLPGSGKSTWAKKLAGAVIVSADDYFTQGGVYAFDPSKLQEAHGDCLRRYVGALQAGMRQVVVDNTNLTVVEVAPYWALASAYGYDVRIQRFEVSIEDAKKRNTHGVPEPVLTKMSGLLEKFDQNKPPWWR